MITGAVNPYREAVIRLPVHGPTASVEVDAIIDTGFTGSLTLSESTLTRLGAPHSGVLRATLADGSEAVLDVYRIEIEWTSGRLTVDSLAAEGAPLLGMKALHGHNLNMDVVDGGTATITLLP